MAKRIDDFPQRVKNAVAKRVGTICSKCESPTCGPKDDPNQAINLGVAAHITAASIGGPRYNQSLTSDERRSINNAIWLCANCSVLIDQDVTVFSETALREMKQRAELRAKVEVGSTPFRAIAPGELIQILSIGERCLVEALEEEFGCHVELYPRIPAGGGWLAPHGAVVRGEDLVVIEMFELRGNELPYFQIEHVAGLCSTKTFDRFKKTMFYVAVISDQPTEHDEIVRGRLDALKTSSRCEFHVRMYRLNSLRAKYNI